MNLRDENFDDDLDDEELMRELAEIQAIQASVNKHKQGKGKKIWQNAICRKSPNFFAKRSFSFYAL